MFLLLACSPPLLPVPSGALDVSLEGVWSTRYGQRPFPMPDAPPELTASHAVQLPADFDPETRVILHTTGTGWRVNVWVEGKQVGTDAGGIRPARVDLTGVLKPGANTLWLQLQASRADNVLLGQSVRVPSAYTYSMPRPGQTAARGDVWLELSGERHVDDVDVGYADGTLTASATVTGAEGESVRFHVVRDGSKLADLGEGTVQSGIARASGAWRGPLWTLGGQGEPFLQYLVATLPDGTARQVRFGARTITRQQRGLALNGHAAYLSVQRHDSAKIDFRSDLAAAQVAYSAGGLNSLELHGSMHGHTLLDAADELGFPVVLTPRCDGRRRDDGTLTADAGWAEFVREGNERMAEAWSDHPSVLLWNLEANAEPAFPEVYSAFKTANAPLVDLTESQGYNDEGYVRMRAEQPLFPYLNELAFRVGPYQGVDLIERLRPLIIEHRPFGIGITLPHVLYSRGSEVTAGYAGQYARDLRELLVGLDVPQMALGQRRGPALVDVTVTRAGAPAPGEIVILRAPGHPPVAAAADALGHAHLTLDYAGSATIEVWGGPPSELQLTPGVYADGKWAPNTTRVALGL